MINTTTQYSFNTRFIFHGIFLSWAFLWCFATQATHIVGGEITLQAKDKIQDLYLLQLNLYFDDVNGNPGALDRQVTLGIFEKGTHRLITSYIMDLKSRDRVAYTYPSCSKVFPNIRTSLLIYEQLVTLVKSDFKAPNGYYVSFSRCCRNGIINNILTPLRTGNTFYLEFPPLDNIYQGNSSPTFRKASGDAACTGQPFSMDFSAQDVDGDSLVYRIVTPFSGPSSPSNPIPGAQEGPYAPIDWTPGFSEKQSIPGNPALTINSQGLLHVIPTQIGLFVFTVLVEEFRQGKKIGEIRRDWQLFVGDCPSNLPPKLLVRKPGTTQLLSSGVIATFNQPTQRILTIGLVDPNHHSLLGIEVKKLPHNWKLGTSLHFTKKNTRGATDTFFVHLTLPSCIETAQPVNLQLVGYDEHCPENAVVTQEIQVVLNKGTVPPPPQLPQNLCVQGDSLALPQDWNFYLNGVSIQKFPLKNPGIYSLKYLYPCTSDTLTQQIQLFPLPEGTPDTLVSICPGDIIELDAGPGADQYAWQNNPQKQGRFLKVKTPGTYQVTLTSRAGCVRDISIQVRCSCAPQVVAPLAFTPNDDGLNDRWFVKIHNVASFELFIYSRWGEVVFSSNSHTTDNGLAVVYWSGKIKQQSLPMDVYAYKIRYQSLCTGKITETTSTLSLIR